MQLTNVNYSTKDLTDWKDKDSNGSVVFKSCTETSGSFKKDEDNQSLKWKHLDSLKIIKGNCNAYIMNGKDKNGQKIEFGDSFEGFPVMTLLAMILANERVLNKEESVENGEQLISSLEKYRNDWMQKKEQQGGGVWLVVKDGEFKGESEVFKGGNINILSEEDSLSSANGDSEIAKVKLLQFQIDLKNGSKEDTSPNIQFRSNQGTGKSTLAYIKFSEEAS